MTAVFGWMFFASSGEKDRTIELSCNFGRDALVGIQQGMIVELAPMVVVENVIPEAMLKYEKGWDRLTACVVFITGSCWWKLDLRVSRLFSEASFCASIFWRSTISWMWCSRSFLTSKPSSESHLRRCADEYGVVKIWGIQLRTGIISSGIWISLINQYLGGKNRVRCDLNENINLHLWDRRLMYVLCFWYEVLTSCTQKESEPLVFLFFLLFPNQHS